LAATKTANARDPLKSAAKNYGRVDASARDEVVDGKHHNEKQQASWRKK